MGKNEFVDASLVNIREKLPASVSDDAVEPFSAVDPAVHRRRSSSASASSAQAKIKSEISEKEWKKAMFARWDEYRTTRRDVLLRLRTLISRIPGDVEKHDKVISTLRVAEKKLSDIADTLENLDDSEWNRATFTSDLASAMKQVENARLECVVIEQAMDSGTSHTPSSAGVSSHGGGDFIHELLSISFSQSFKLGLGFFFPLILVILASAVLLALFNYLAVN